MESRSNKEKKRKKQKKKIKIEPNDKASKRQKKKITNRNLDSRFFPESFFFIFLFLIKVNIGEVGQRCMSRDLIATWMKNNEPFNMKIRLLMTTLGVVMEGWS